MKPHSLIAIAVLGVGLGAQTQDPSAPGPLPVTNTQYKFESVQIPQIAYPVDIWATVWHPEDLSGAPYPLLVFLHGNHGICRQVGTSSDFATSLTPPFCPAGFTQTQNHLGYDYVASRLAGYGYIIVSINANAINTRPNGNSERGRLVQEHLRYWAIWNSSEGGFPFNKTFSGKVNLRNVGLMGHSRGGEGVRAAYNFNRREGSPFGIRAVLEVGPVDFGRLNTTSPNPLFNVDGVPFSVILPACDADVSDNQGMRVYDRARVIRETSTAPKSQIYIYAANHNFYNSQWAPEDSLFRCIDFPILTVRPPQEQIGLVYMMGFFRNYIGGEDFRNLFTGDSTPPESVGVPIAQSYQESSNDILLIDDFSARRAPDVNSAGGSNLTTNVDVRACAGSICNTPAPGAWFNDPATFAGKISWPLDTKDTPTLTMRLAEGGEGQDVSKMMMVAFRVAAQFSTLNPVLPASQNFSVRLLDASGKTSTSVAAADARPIPYPTGWGYRRSMLRTMRLPLESFKGVDLTSIAAIQFVFDKTPQGAIFLTDVHLSPR
ncbi:MAG: hypothetical protein HY820_43440 [Acidobacteria bacterium]|nr:hypothetical protein [Acidobacteriota bacterium]